MNKIKTILLTTAAAGVLSAAIPAQAQDYDSRTWQIRLRSIGVLPDESSSVNIGGKVDVDDTLVPELDISYFFYPTYRRRADPGDVGA